jgi:diguanylate cyclase (GGDEF)-like protein/PAS domain S-box-containing protein
VLGRFGPLAVSVATLAAISMGLIGWSHMGWNRLQQQAHAFDTLLPGAQTEARLSLILAKQTLGAPQNAPTDTAQAVDEPIAQAIAKIKTLQESAPETMRASLASLTTLLEHTRDDLRQPLTEAQWLPGTQLHDALSRIDAATAGISQQWVTELDDETAVQHLLDKLNIALVGGVTLLLLTLMWRAHRQREHATLELKDREAQLLAFAEVLPDLAFRMDHEGRFLAVYGSNLPLLGRPPESVIGHPLSTLFPADMSARFMTVLGLALKSRSTQALPFSVRLNGQIKHFDSRCAAVGESGEVVWMIWDTSAHRHTEKSLSHKTRLYDFLSHVNQSIVRSTDAATLLERVCCVALEHGKFQKAWVVMQDPANPLSLHSQAVAGNCPPAADTLGFQLNADASTDTKLDAALRQGRTYCSSNLGLLATRPSWADQAIAEGLPGCVTVPLIQNEALIGHLILLGRRVNDQAEDLLDLFTDVANDLSFALTNMHRESLRHLAEQRIRLHAAALESMPDGMMVLGRDRRLVSVNPAFSSITGYLEAEVIGLTPDFLLSDKSDETQAEMRQGIISQGSWQGELWFKRKCGDLFMTKLSVSVVRNQQGRPTHFVGVFTDITLLKQTEERLARMAHFDTLTELPNRVMIHQRLAHAVSLAQRHRTLVGVIFIDLDNFKTVNDGLGHAAGDCLLKQVARRLRERIRQEDTLGRLGGDEFILVLEHLRHPQQAAQVAAAMLETLNHPFTLDGGQQVYVRASIGISMFPNDGADAGELIRNADAAMYESKRRGRNSFSFYTEAFTSDATLRLQLETRLRRAVEHNEFALHYQPLVRLRDRRVIAVEALVRLRNPVGSDPALPAVSPAQFIPVMEETGMIVALGEWVLREACRQGRAWLDEGVSFGRISVNLSPSEVRRGGVAERVSRILKETGLPATCLELEITESGLMETGGDVEQFLHTLHKLGVTLSIDDFGTGYSSLAYLKRFPVHQLKIDRSFIQDLPGNDNDSQLVSTMIAMARGMNLRVVAEGVEMPDQETLLASKGCDIAQGYLYSRPLPAEQLSQYLIENQFKGQSVQTSEEITLVQ